MSKNTEFQEPIRRLPPLAGHGGALNGPDPVFPLDSPLQTLRREGDTIRGPGVTRRIEVVAR